MASGDNGQTKTKGTDECYTRLPHEIVRDYLPFMKEGELKITLIVVDETYGWEKPFVILDLAELHEKTGLSKPTIRKGIEEGLERGTIQRSEHPKGWAYRINPDLVRCQVTKNARQVEARKNLSRSKQEKMLPDASLEQEKILPKNGKNLSPFKGERKKEIMCDKDFQHGTATEASFTQPPAEEKPQDGLPKLETKPEDRNTPRDPLYAALSEVCNGNGTGGTSFMATLKGLNLGFLSVADLDDLVERWRERNGFPYPAPAQILSYLPQYLLERDEEEEKRLKRLERRKYQEQKDADEREKNRQMSQYLKDHPEILKARREHPAAVRAALQRGETPPPFPTLAAH